MTLDEVGIAEGTDKSSLCHGYLPHYDRLFRDLRELPITLIEIGVFDGASLRTWRSYFTRARIVGVDIDPRCQKHATDGIEIFIGSQADAAFLAELGQLAPPNIVIDDGSHRADHIPFTLAHLFPVLAPGGCYVVEDLPAHLGPEAAFWRGEADRPPTDDFASTFVAVAARKRHDVERVEAFPGTVAFWKSHGLDPRIREQKIRAVLDTGKGTAYTWYYYAGFLRSSLRLDEAEEAIVRAIGMGGEGPWFQTLLNDIRQAAASAGNSH